MWRKEPAWGMGRRGGQWCVKKQKILEEGGGEDVGFRVGQENAQLGGEEPRLTTLFFYHTDSRDQTQVIGLGGKHMYLLSHLLSPSPGSLWTTKEESESQKEPSHRPGLMTRDYGGGVGGVCTLSEVIHPSPSHSPSRVPAFIPPSLHTDLCLNANGSRRSPVAGSSRTKLSREQ